ncbi:MAG: hypothetical protein V1729_00975 [Candidatus Woesearchaeota archaeon]
MRKKEAYILIPVILVISLVILTGCDGRDKITCKEPEVLIYDVCCNDTNINNMCDFDELEFQEYCGNGICDGNESCTDCWKDCGACKKIVYVYIPRNFTYTELTADIEEWANEDLKFTKDIYNKGEISDFYYQESDIPRYFAEFLDVKYKYLYPSRTILLSHITQEPYYINETSELLDVVTHNHWYIIHNTKNSESARYEERITSNKSMNDYPTQPTGRDKLFRYENWEYRNFTKYEMVIEENISILQTDMVESLYASITNYTVFYKTGEFTNEDDEDFAPIPAYKGISEIKLTYVQALTLRCARNLAITLYEYDYNKNYYNINERDLHEQIRKNRATLKKKAESLKRICDAKYSQKVFIYDAQKTS